ncbi:MAG: oligosaccharide flippase family protein, partial [Anaerolineae bacterium]
GPVLSLSFLTVTLAAVTVAAMVSFLASYLAASVLGSAGLACYLRMGAVLVVTISLEGVLAGALNGFQEFRMIGRANIVQALVALPTTVLCVFTAGLPGAVAALTLSSALRACFLGHAVVKLLRREGIRLGCKGMWGERSILWRFALPAMGSGLLVIPVTWWCSVVLARQAGGYAGLGIFNAANQWRTALLLVPSIVGNVTLPLLAEAYAQDGYRLAGKLTTLLFRLFWTGLLPVAAILVGFSKLIMTLYGWEFQDGYAVLAVLVLATYVQAILTCLASLIAASGRMWLGMAMNLGWAAILLGATYILVPQFGVLGLAVAYLAAYALHMVWALVFGASVCGAVFLKETAAMIFTAIGAFSGILWLTTLGPWVAPAGALGVAGALLIRVWWCLPRAAKESVVGIVRGFVTGGVHR